ALDAVDRLDGVDLLLAGDGEERGRLQARGGAHARFLGALPRDGVLELFAAADAAVLTPAWEDFPHLAVEALAVGTPVIATDVGGVGEIVTDGENGLLVPPGDAGVFADAVRRFFADDALRDTLRANAARSVARFSGERVLDTLEAVLEQAAA